MGVQLPTVTAVLFALAVPAVSAQGTVADGTTVAVNPGVDLGRLPINVSRISRQIRQADVKEERNGLRLNYTIQVYGEAPKLKLFTPLDNLMTGTVPGSAPTHNDMIRQMTPLEFSAPVMSLGSYPSRK